MRFYLQISHEFERFSVYLNGVKTATFFGGLPMKAQIQTLKEGTPQIVVGTPGRLKQASPPNMHVHLPGSSAWIMKVAFVALI